RALRPGPAGPRAVPVEPAPLGRIVYFPSCATRMFGAPATELGLMATPDAMVALLARAGFEPVVPEALEGRCCGQPFLSKGFPEESARVGARLAAELDQLGAADGCRLVTDASTCARHMQGAESPTAEDSAAFLIAEVLPRVQVRQR